MGASIELLVQVRLGAQNIHPIVLILTEAGRARTGQQDELCEAMKVRHVAESLQHQDHGDQPQEEVGCKDGRGVMGGPLPWAGPKGYRNPHGVAMTFTSPSHRARWPSKPPGQSRVLPSALSQPPHSPVTSSL